MKRSKKTAALLLALSMTASLFSGCAKKQDDPAEPTGYEAAVRDYFNAVNSLNGTRDYYDLIWPKEYIKNCRDEDDKAYRAMIADRDEIRNSEIAQYEFTPVFMEVTISEPLSDREIDEAEHSYQTYFGLKDPHISEGYNITYSCRGSDGIGCRKKVRAVNLYGDGWKIIEGLISDIPAKWIKQ